MSCAMIAPLLTLSLLALGQTPSPPEEAPARVEHLDPQGPSAAQSVDTRSATLNPTLTHKKSVNVLVALGELAIGSLAGYLALVVGIALNLPHGGVSAPADANDILYLGVFPTVATAALSWLVGLFDWGQRSVLGSAIWAVLGAAAGELAGLGLGDLLGHALYPNDHGASAIVTIFFAPAVSAIGAMIFMEAFKPGQDVYASINLTRTRSGALALGPAFGLRF